VNNPRKASVAPRTTIWVQAAPLEGSTNWGKKARKKSATLGLRICTSTLW